jgi:muramoyltetrapeptide carboxypeptidase LdcA involved in peptidoglycan recycling
MSYRHGMPTPVYPPKPRPGDRVAIVSPASGLAGILPLPFDLGLKRLSEDFGLIPVEFPTTRKMGSSAAERAADLHAAFADPDIKAVIASIGGDDQISVLKHLDADLIRANPKPFFGYSDNTNLLAYLSDLGIVGYHGGSVMTELGRPGAMHPLTADSVRAALFGCEQQYELTASPNFTDMGRDWRDAATFESEPEMQPGTGWTWRNHDQVVSGRSWGGCLEIVAWLLMADIAIPALSDFDGAVLFFETSEEMPDAVEVYRILRNMGERGILERCGALLMARPRAWSFDEPHEPAERAAFVAAQYEAVERAMNEYAEGTPIVLGIDFGHTDPQLVIPYGGEITVDGPARQITVRY